MQSTFPQENKEISKEKSDLKKIKSEISSLEKEIKNKTKKEKESFTFIENYNKQNHLLNKVINNLRKEEEQKQQEIEGVQTNVKSLEEEIKSLQDNYTKYIISIYKHGKRSELASLFDSESVEQAFLRVKYLQKFSQKRERDLQTLKQSKENLYTAKLILEKEKIEKAVLIKDKQQEEKGLQTKLSERKKILNAIKNDKAELKKELNAKKKAEKRIKNLIIDLIAKAEKKKNEEKKKFTGSKISENKKTEDLASSDFSLDLTGFSSFKDLKGKLNWPVTRGVIIRKFGENKNTKLNTITLNYGVDIKASSDLSVKSVAGGIVSAIDYIPGYGSVIIITHRDDYRTVYSHLSEIFINEGDKVKPGSLIAKIGESLEGNILHFEIWSSRNNQNPELWLVKR
jgi:septal ring factor EnvC (AmiA/AmiB activator)